MGGARIDKGWCHQSNQSQTKHQTNRGSNRARIERTYLVRSRADLGFVDARQHRDFAGGIGVRLNLSQLSLDIVVDF